MRNLPLFALSSDLDLGELLRLLSVRLNGGPDGVLEQLEEDVVEVGGDVHGPDVGLVLVEVLQARVALAAVVAHVVRLDVDAGGLDVVLLGEVPGTK